MTFTDDVVAIIKSIPAGRVATYGQIAKLAGNPQGACQVVRVLHTQSKKHSLPWHRVINAQGQIVIRAPAGAAIKTTCRRCSGIRDIFNRSEKIFVVS